MVALKRAVQTGGHEVVLAQHRAGALDQARAGYERLLSESPDDPDVLGLLGVLVLQQGRMDDAEVLLRRALGAPRPDPAVHLRNLNNLFAMYHAAGSSAAAAKLACDLALDWLSDWVPEAADVDRAISLAEAITLAGQPRYASALIERMLTSSEAGADAFLLAGRLQMALGDAAAAIPHFERAASLAPASWEVQGALSAAHGKTGDEPSARAAALRCALAAPTYVARPQQSQRATILTLNPVPPKIAAAYNDLGDVHFTRNFVAQASKILAAEYRFASVFADLLEPLPAIPGADLVFNNLACGEVLCRPGKLERAIALIDRIDRPVINHPEAVAAMTRQKGAALLQGVPGLHVPRIERYQRDLWRFDEIAADVAAKFAYPVILRHPATDSSAKLHKTGNETAIRVAAADEMRAFLERVAWPEFYVIQFVDLQRPDGNYCKVRATFIGGEIILSRCQFGPEWMVGATSTANFYDRFPERAAEMQRILADPTTMLGPRLMPVLEAIRERVPLDLFGLDFDVDVDGNVVMFEAQATMILIPTPDSPDYEIAPKEPGRRILAAFRRLVAKKLGLTY